MNSINTAERRIEIALKTKSDSLDLSGLSLDRLPLSIFQLVFLKCLDVSRNNLHEISGLIEQLRNLTEIDLSDNPIVTIPESMGSLKKLRVVTFSGEHKINYSHLKCFYDSTHIQVVIAGIRLPRRYFVDIEDWELERILYEGDDSIRRWLIKEFGCQKICEKLQAIELDASSEFTLLKFTNTKCILDGNPIVCLKSIFSPTGEIDLARFPHEISSIKEAMAYEKHHQLENVRSWNRIKNSRKS
jgi:hypothetical protein